MYHIHSYAKLQIADRPHELKLNANLQGRYPDKDFQLAVQAHQAGDLTVAEQICKNLTAKHPNYGPAHNLLGSCAASRGDLKQAVVHYGKAIRIEPHSLDFALNLCHCYRSIGDHSRARRVLEEFVDDNPTSAQAHVQLSIVAFENGDLEACVAELRRACEISPQSEEAHLRLALILKSQGKPIEAKTYAERTIEIAPEKPDGYRALGEIYLTIGKFKEAEEAFWRASELTADKAPTFIRITGMRRFSEADRPLIDRMDSLLTEGEIRLTDQIELLLSLGKIADDLGDYGLSMRRADKAHELAAQILSPIDREKQLKKLATIKATFDQDFFGRRSDIGDPSDTPLLIVGMPRCGSTLVQQILASHPQIGEGGELGFWNEDSAFHPFQNMSREAVLLKEIASEYLSALRQFDAEALRVIDKTNSNYVYLGGIHTIFPNARIIHCTRHPVDLCLSNYLLTAGLTFGYRYDREEILFIYRLYSVYREHWKQVIPNSQIHQVDYSDLVSNPEPVIRNLLEFVGVPWDPACLRHHEATNSVRTPSSWQVRQPLYRTSTDRWRNYTAGLGVFRELLTEDEMMALS